VRTKAIILTATVAVGLGLFWVKYQDYFGRGATSVAARTDYWRAAMRTLATKPGLGSGPGTFMVSYKHLKPPGAEMTLHRKSRANMTCFGVWLGLLGLVLQSCVEFGLYVPSLSWPFFLLFGWLFGVENQGIGSTNQR
jgi:hypothetical protein